MRSTTRATMSGLLFAWCVLTVWCGVPARAGETGAETSVLRSTVRIRYERSAKDALITGHGTAFGVDLSQFGYTGKRYLLSAAHNVLDDSQVPYSTLKVELTEGARRYWSPCRAVAYDREIDLCLVELAVDLPEVLQLGTAELSPGNPVLLAGSPRGVPVALFRGTMLRRFEHGTVRSSVQIPFEHGDSGGPVISPRTGKVSGVAVAGIPKDGDLDHDVGLFVPLAGIASFLDSNRRQNAPLAATPALPAVAVRTNAVTAAQVEHPKTAPLLRWETAEPLAECVDLPEASPAPASSGLNRAAAVRTSPAPYRVTSVAVPPAPRPNAPAPALAVGEPLCHYVTTGDTLPQIAKTYGVTVDDLVRVNRMPNVYCIAAGTKLIIPDPH